MADVPHLDNKRNAVQVKFAIHSAHVLVPTFAVMGRGIRAKAAMMAIGPLGTDVLPPVK